MIPEGARVLPRLPAEPPAFGKSSSVPLSRLLHPGRILEISGDRECACTTTAASIVIHFQTEGELVAWVQWEDGGLYPPDLALSGVQLESLLCAHLPRSAPRHVPLRATELLLRSGAFGLVVLDLRKGVPPGDGSRWQGRLAGVLREHEACLVILTPHGRGTPSLGPLISLRIESRREPESSGVFRIHHQVLKTKVGSLSPPTPELRRAPDGLCPV